MIRAALKEVLMGYGPWADILNLDLPVMYGGKKRPELFRLFHFPKNKAEQQGALEALKFDEALQLQLALAERRKGRTHHESTPMRNTSDKSKKIRSYFPYSFTGDQQSALGQTIGDMGCTHRPMQRLIHGEVGSGKTAVAFYSAMLTALNGKRTLILCPTTILADQHYQTLKGMGWDDVMLYTGRKSVPKLLPKIIIGTHSLLNWEYLHKLASLVIVDEFQKFGVEQRAKLQKNNPHLLLLSATPIPRTLAATAFGDLDISVIKELPIKRGTVITKQVLPDRREGMYEIIENELAKGHQAYVVYPRISGDEDVVSAERGYDELVKRFENTVILTGRADSERKADVLRRFKASEIDILVSTIIAEVGLDNPNATVMVIEGADRFGLSQLHQLRGRVCRSTDTAFCFLVSETANPTSIARLEAIERTNDGFLIAEEDLRLRGPGEVFSTRQSGLPDLKWISLVDDYDLMIEAHDLVADELHAGNGVREMMRIRYGDNLQLGGTV
ncbi:MAG: DEAD/DEAH box helicase [Ketobacter sp.]|nr:DEAD/DEAH box helicase [Ketobacter sp.]